MNLLFRPATSFVLNVLLVATVGLLGVARLARPLARAKVTTVAPRMSPARPRPTPERLYAAARGSAVERRRAIVDRLRELGVPNELRALVARVDFETEWESRFDACHGATDKLQALQLEMDLSKDREMKQALGEADFRKWDQTCMLWEAMSTPVAVSPAEADTIYGLKKALQERQHQVEQARLNGTMDDAQINAAYDQAYASYFQQLKSVLGDERFATSQQLDDAFVTENLRAQFSGVHATDAQLADLLNVEKASRQSRLELDHQFQNDLSSAAYQEKLSALTEAEKLEYERVLGADAYQQYVKGQDAGYVQMKKYETHWGLDDAKVDFVYGAMKAYTQQIDELKGQVHAMQAAGQTVDWGAAQQKLRSVNDQTLAVLRDKLGPDAFSALQRNGVLRFVQIQHAPGRS